MLKRIGEEASNKTTSEKIGYGPLFDFDEHSWFQRARIATSKNAEDINYLRHKIIEGEAHFQLACCFVGLMVDSDVLDYRLSKKRKGLNPWFRVATHFATLMTNQELLLLSLVDGETKHHPAQTLSHRYYLTTNSARPFLEYEAQIMVGLGLWKIEFEERQHRVSAGPYLRDYMSNYRDVVSWAQALLGEILNSKS